MKININISHPPIFTYMILFSYLQRPLEMMMVVDCCWYYRIVLLTLSYIWMETKQMRWFCILGIDKLGIVICYIWNASVEMLQFITYLLWCILGGFEFRCIYGICRKEDPERWWLIIRNKASFVFHKENRILLIQSDSS